MGSWGVGLLVSILNGYLLHSRCVVGVISLLLVGLSYRAGPWILLSFVIFLEYRANEAVVVVIDALIIYDVVELLLALGELVHLFLVSHQSLLQAYVLIFVWVIRWLKLEALELLAVDQTQVAHVVVGLCN